MNTGRVKIGAALVFTSAFLPMLFQGEEWGATTPFLYFTDYPEPELAAGVREGRCREFASFGWDPAEVPDPQARASFERSKLDWSEMATPEHADLLDWHRRLIHLRRVEPDLNDGRMECVVTRHSEKDQWLVIERGLISVACNFASKPQQIPIRTGGRTLLLASSAPDESRPGQIGLPQDSVAIMKFALQPVPP